MSKSLSIAEKDSLSLPSKLFLKNQSCSFFSLCLFAVLNGNVPPNNCQKASRQRHPNHAHRRGHTCNVISKMQFGKEESECGWLHGRFNGHGARFDLAKACKFGEPVADQASDEMEEKDGELRMCVIVLFFERWVILSCKWTANITQSIFTCNEIPAFRMGSATWATALATRRQVETTPTTGAKGRMALTNLGKNLLADIPMAMGARTTYRIAVRQICESMRLLKEK